MPKTETSIKKHVWKTTIATVNDYIAKIKKDTGVDVTFVQALDMLVMSGYKSKTGKDPRRRTPARIR